MSSIKLESNASGTGVFTIASPNSNTNRTLTLPDATGTIITTAGGAAISGTTGTFTGLVDISAAGAGQIQFPATQNASSNANTLDDYEEGTWTPTLLGEGSAGTTTYTNQGGRYTKVGNMVTVWCDLSYSAATGTGSLFIGSLPFSTFNDSGNLRYPGACIVQNLNWSAGISYLQAFAQASSTNVNLQGSSDDGAWVEQQVVNESARITFTLTYRVA